MKIIAGTYKGATKYAVSFPSGGRSGLFNTEDEARAYIDAWNKPAQQLADKTSDAYSADRYGSYWVKCAALLLDAGFTPDEAEEQLRSKNMRWAADGAEKHTTKGFYTSFAAMLSRNTEEMKAEARRWIAQNAPVAEVITTRTLKTSDLLGVDLDYAVAKCEVGAEWGRFQPSTDWSQGGPIIERENITIIRANSAWDGVKNLPVWFAETDKCVGHNINTSYEGENFDPAFMIDEDAGVYGPTPLIAAMRCYVASKLGDTIEVPHH